MICCSEYNARQFIVLELNFAGSCIVVDSINLGWVDLCNMVDLAFISINNRFNSNIYDYAEYRVTKVNHFKISYNPIRDETIPRTAAVLGSNSHTLLLNLQYEVIESIKYLTIFNIFVYFYL